MNLPESPRPYFQCAQLRELVAIALAYPRFLSIGAISNTVEVRMSREVYEAIRAQLAVPATSEGTDD